MLNKTELLSFVILITIAVSLFMFSATALADPDNETWYDANWGGDTGEENYSEPIIDGTKGGGGFCSSTILMGCVMIPSLALLIKKRWKHASALLIQIRRRLKHA